MELPNVGKNCHQCKQLDFLAVACTKCQNYFCENHRINHCCSNIQQKGNFDAKPFKRCGFDSCKNIIMVDNICKQCDKNFCLTHRFHGCKRI